MLFGTFTLIFFSVFRCFIVKSAVQTERPNILVIVADDLGVNDLGYTGATDCFTPNLDDLSDTGLTLTRFYAYPHCTPTRAAFLTGRYTFRYGLHTGVIGNAQPIGLDLNEITVANELHDAPIGKTAYRNYLLGKWHLGFCHDDYCPPGRGFDEFYGMWTYAIDRRTMLSQPEGRAKGSNWIGYDFHDGPDPVNPFPNPLFADDAWTDRALDYLDGHLSGGAHESEPFFLTMSFSLPHEPIQTQNFYDNLPDILSINKDKRRRYCSMVANMDANIGLILNRAKSDPAVWDNTYVIFFSDNGGVQTRGAASNYPFRSGKGSVWEGGVRVPMIFNGGKLASERRGTKYDEMIHATDLMPTILGLAGQTPSAAVIDGVDVSNLLKTNSSDPSIIRDTIILQVHSQASCDMTLERTPGNPERICGAVIQGNFKLVVGNGVSVFNSFRKGGWVIIPNQNENVYPSADKLYSCPDPVPTAASWDIELTKCPFVSTTEGCLYNLRLDPCETRNIAQNSTGRYNQLKSLLFDALDSAQAVLSTASIDEDANPAHYADFFWRSWLNPGNTYSPTMATLAPSFGPTKKPLTMAPVTSAPI